MSDEPIPLGSLVELESGVRLYVAWIEAYRKGERYALSPYPEHYFPGKVPPMQDRMNGGIMMNYGRDSITLVRTPRAANPDCAHEHVEESWSRANMNVWYFYCRDCDARWKKIEPERGPRQPRTGETFPLPLDWTMP